MERARALHTMTVEMTTGMLVLATLAVVVLAWLAFSGRERRRVSDAADAVALWGAVIGTPMIALAILSGFRQWPLEAFLNSVIARNKILTALVALGFWAAFLCLRLAAGKRLWDDRRLSVLALVLAVGGGVSLVFTASIGGTLAHKPSGFEELARVVVETRRTFAFSPAGAVALAVLGLAAPLVALWLTRRRPSRLAGPGSAGGGKAAARAR
jgi:hypothetical protein